MTIALVVGYLIALLAIGFASNRLLVGTGEDYFVATRSIGPFVLLMSLFGTHMTAFALLGASAEAYHHGIGVFALMASSSAIVIPLVFRFVGLPLWSLGKRHGYLTQVQFFRDRFGSDTFGLLMFVALLALLVPYMLIAVIGSGLSLSEVTAGAVPQWVGGALTSLVVLAYVTFGGLRGTAWVNTFQTVIFMSLGAFTFAIIVADMGGLEAALARVAAEHPDLLVRGHHMTPWALLSYTLIPLSAGMFPHLFMNWLSARRAETFRLTIVAYPLCIAIVWVPSVLLGVLGSVDVPGLIGPATNSLMMRMIANHAPATLAALLAAGVFAAVMSSLDSQVLAVGTMFTQDIVRHYGFHDRMSERHQVLVGRGFVVIVVATIYGLSLVVDRSIFKLGIWSFTGFASLFPLVVAALYWRRSTLAGAYASFATAVTLGLWFLRRGWSVPDYSILGTGLLPVAVVFVAASAMLIAVSLVTRPPADAVLERFFPPPAPACASRS